MLFTKRYNQKLQCNQQWKKNFYDQVIDSDIKWYKEIRELTTGQGQDYTTECLLDSEYIKSSRSYKWKRG